MNGYAQINIDGTAVDLYFGYLAIKAFQLAAEKKRDMYYEKVKQGEEEVEQFSFLGYAKLIECGYKNNCEVEEVQPTYTLKDFNYWVEGSVNNPERQTQIVKVLEAFFYFSIREVAY
jgi:hypothetical protein